MHRRAPSRRRSLPLGLLLAGLILGASAMPAAGVTPAAFPATEFPPDYEGYHTYAEMVAELDAAVADHPTLVRKFSIGRSYEGREIWVAKISDNVAIDENEPEALFDSLIHAREHLTVEMNLHLLNLLTDGYAGNQRIANIVNSREIFLIFMLNPDGGEYDIASGEFQFWRKNRQPIPGSSHIGIDLNRNFGFKWGCCEGSSGRPRDETYRGWSSWVAPEVQAYRDFIRSRVVNGHQQLRVAISWHTSMELILWPYGYSSDPNVRTMTLDDRRTFEALGQQMAELNGYTPQASHDLYITDGDQKSWSHYEHRIFHFTFEMYPANIDFYPTDEHILPQTARNREAVFHLLELADCPYRAAGLGTTLCGPLADDFEVHRGWQINPYGTDTATRGKLVRSIALATSNSGGAKQRTAASGQADLVTGRLAGRSVNDHDIDGGVTSALSPAFSLDGGSGWRLFLRYTFAHDARASAADYLRVSVVDGGQRTLLWSVSGKAQNRNAAWTTRTVSLDQFAGRTVRLLVQAADGGADSLVEAALDDVRVYPSSSGAIGASTSISRALPGGAGFAV